MTSLLTPGIEDKLPEFMTSKDLVSLGLYPNPDAVHLARIRGQSPDYLQVGRKILYPKTCVLKFVGRHLRSGEADRRGVA